MKKPFVLVVIFLILLVFNSACEQEPGVYSISPIELTPQGSLLTAVNDEMDYHRTWTVTYPKRNQHGSFSFVAPVHLPNGAKVVKVEVNVTDDDGDVDNNYMDLTLCRAKFDSSNTDVYLAIISTRRLASSPDRITLFDDTIEYDTIDNNNYAYVLRIEYYGPIGPDPWLIFWGAKIIYE